MGDRIRIIRRVVVYYYVLTRQGAERKRLDEFTSPRGHCNPDHASGFLQPPQDFRRLVGRNAATDSEGNLPAWGNILCRFVGHSQGVKLKINVTLLKQRRNGGFFAPC